MGRLCQGHNDGHGRGQSQVGQQWLSLLLALKVKVTMDTKVKVKLDVKVKLAETVECRPVRRLLVDGDVIADRRGDNRRACNDDDVTSGSRDDDARATSGGGGVRRVVGG